MPAHTPQALLMFTPIRVALGLGLIAGLFWMMESLWPHDEEQPRWRRDSGGDVGFFLFTHLLGQKIAALFVLAALGVTVAHLPATGWNWSQHLPTWLQALAILMIGDFCAYWAHRFTHCNAFFWRFHAVHHSPTQMDWLSTTRVHPLDGVIQKMLTVVPLYLLGLNQGALELYTPSLSLFAVFMHANVSWNLGLVSYLVATPQFHRWHHCTEPAALNKNFCGMFPVFDWAFGTLYFPRGATPKEYGIVGEPVRDGFWGQMVNPLLPARASQRAPTSFTVGDEQDWREDRGERPVEQKEEVLPVSHL